ncbi:MAG: DNA primase [Endomicrobium sp.]|jgi:DNA primase|nr:DNA primase [Endomicrobium sp.]
MTISHDIIEKIRMSNDIESVVKEYLPDLKVVGRNLKVRCPFHDEKTPSFIISPEKGIFKCFGCNIVGDVFKFVMLINNISWIEAVKKLAIKSKIKIYETKQEAFRVSEKIKLLNILKISSEFYHEYLIKNINARKARDYLKKRGINHEMLKKFKIGYAPKGQLLMSLIHKNGYTMNDILRSGVGTKIKNEFFEYMADRIVFPIFNVHGSVIAFGGRSIGNHNIKYLNTPETLLYSKSSILYGLFQALPNLCKDKSIIILEGYIDVIISQQFGITGSVAILGTTFSKNHAKLISRYSNNVILLFDSDTAGRSATQKSLEILVKYYTSINISVPALPENVDIDEYLNKYGKEEFLKLLKNSSKGAIDFMISKTYDKNIKNSPEVKAMAISTLLNFVLKSPSVIIQREWIKIIAQNIGVTENLILEEFKNKQKLNFNTRNHNVKNLIKVITEISKKSISLEENLLNFILNNRDYIKKIDVNYFREERCKRVFNLLISGVSDVDILNILSEQDAEWFSNLTLNVVKYSDLVKAFGIILKDVKFDILEKERRQLESKIILMNDENKKDAEMFEKYKKLTVFLKGSTKNNK